jgi:Ribbon-helix-helix protein, copG family.
MPRKLRNRVVVTLTMSPQMKEILMRYASERRMNMSRLVEMALEEFIKRRRRKWLLT